MVRQTFALEDIHSSWQRTGINLSLVGECVLLWTVVRVALMNISYLRTIRNVGSARIPSMYAVNSVVLRVTRNHVLKEPFVSSSTSIEAGSRIFNSSFDDVETETTRTCYALRACGLGDLRSHSRA